MKKTLTLVMLVAMTTASPLFAQEKKIKVIDNLSSPTVEAFGAALGSDRYSIDSLVISTPLPDYGACFSLIRDCCENGRLTGIDLLYSRIGYIPANAFLPSVINGKPRKKGGDDEKNPARTNLRYITLPSRLELIGENAFACTNLEAIEIPYLTRTIKDGAFADCELLKNVFFVGKKSKADESGYGFSGLPSGAVLHVAKGLADNYRGKASWAAFSDVREQTDLYNVMDITLDGSRTLEEMAQGCDMMCVDSMKLSGLVTKADMAFLKPNVRYGRLKCLDLSDSEIEDGELFSCRMECLRMPKQMKTIHHGFLSKSSIDMLTMPESYEEIGHTAFEYYNWFADSTLVVPEGCKKLSYQAFLSCKSIKTLFLPSTLDILEPNSLGFSFSLGGRAVSTDIYINRMYPPVSTQRCEYRDEDIDPWSEFGPFGCDDSDKGESTCQTRNMCLFVPIGAKKNYANAEHWDHFRTIIETPLLTGTPSGIAEAVTTFKPTSSSAADGIYTVDGRLVTRDTAAKGQLRGLYVVRENGTARKVVF